MYAPDVHVGPDGTRPGSGGQMRILEPPGTYTVKLSIGGRDYTQPLTIRKDPHSAGTEADIAEQQRMLLDVRRDLDTTVDAINGTEMIRNQIAHVMTMMEENSELKRAARELDQKLAAAEGTLVELRATGRGQDGVRWGSRLVQKFSYLGNGLAGGDFKPTNQQLAVHKDLQDRLKKSQGQINDVISKELSTF